MCNLLFNSPSGRKLYQNSLAYLVFLAWEKLNNNQILEMGQSMADGIFYSAIHTHTKQHIPISADTLDSLDKELALLIKQNLPIEKIEYPYTQALKYFKEKNRHLLISLLEGINEPTITLYQCNNIIDFAFGPIVENSGLISTYKIEPYKEGFILRKPKDITKNNFAPLGNNDLLFSIYNEYRQWSKILHINGVGDLNNLIYNNKLSEFIQINEILQDTKISSIAREIFYKKEKLKLILIAGPSSSGKTTFTKKLSTHLQVLGIEPSIIEMDDYFLPNDQTPKDEFGKPDFESVEAINIDLLNKQMLELFKGEEVEVPIFDFKVGRPKEKGRPLSIGNKTILIMEGIHGLNQRLTQEIPRENKFLIYVSALTQLKLDEHNRITTTDNRLIRRLVRDSKFRGTPAIKTFQMWDSVRRGESKNIFPFQGNADIAFNSALNYELPVLKIFATPLLRTIKPDDPFYNEARRISRLLDYLLPIPTQDVPDYSILREFIGGSKFHY